MDEINKVSSNPRDSRHYDTSNPCAVCGNNGHTFDKCDILKKHYLLKRNFILLYLCNNWLNLLQTYWSTESISQINTTNETDVFDPYFLMGQE